MKRISGWLQVRSFGAILRSRSEPRVKPSPLRPGASRERSERPAGFQSHRAQGPGAATHPPRPQRSVEPGSRCHHGLPPRGFLFTIDGVNASGDPELRSLGIYQDFNYIKGSPSRRSSRCKIAKNIFSAEIANTIGGHLNLITKGGSNQYHGSTFWNYQAGGPNARNQFSLVRPSLVFHQFGGSVDSPVIHDKMFFFAAFEGYRLTSQGTVTRNVPSPELRALNDSGRPRFEAAIRPLPSSQHNAGGRSRYRILSRRRRFHCQ
ncbi:MAG TPA: hypothetical protein VL285_18885 [Bryobacteraceae bacterium]|nr:hypothetical protein [Bryobacteraceae bacterium]